MARITKLPDPENAPPGSSRFLIELTRDELKDINDGGAATFQVALPISAPNATYTIKRERR